RRIRCAHLDANGSKRSPRLVTASDTRSARNHAEPASCWMFAKDLRDFPFEFFAGSPGFAKERDHFPIECRDVIQFATSYQPVIGDDFCPPMFLRALRMSGLSEGHEVSLRPRAASTSTTVHGRWQIAGLPASKKCLTKRMAWGFMRRVS